ncbi:DUF1552 domain-containing protein [Tuwongella immobilis]|uniref:Secreted protein containing DUF1552 n=1 Tax=Tuwongella immobilis TaxID=692036 RepID=A0A6C2YHL4_9BACT|nr:DUF1552 domain-containing protein [Tuwongella immobilis]VIP00741.1 Uncharacterized protein OS=Pirellula staleyi (strain ATCC 27377 / DSM 6068 / ICPB 4128) GN=Psta_1488 PE=4 SV=1: HXXSHH [Tuwongella immobilis]VTR96900.1 Uncharacterized protein OS=Pirellula staleyi (strain ATCC 27377 / DSM 6068 / ICPB 4128) GN=Psta_1488 PE=4 SV=1: HXXSHH [Tuwongella immobilis]
MAMHSITRRTMLRGLGTALALPMLEAMPMVSAAPITTAAAAAGKKSPLRVAFLYVPNGVNMADWKPTAEGANFELPDILKPLQPFRNKINVLTGLTLDKARANGDGPGDHARAMSAFLTGRQPRKTHGADIRAGQSADQYIATRLSEETQFRSLELGIERGQQAGNCDSGYSCAYSSNLSWHAESTPNAKETDPKQVFERLFGNGSAEERAASRAKRDRTNQSILDFVREDVSSLKRELGAGDQRKLDEYFSAVRELELRIERMRTQLTRTAPKPNMPTPTGVPSEVKEHIRIMIDLMVLAFQTDLTRVITLPFANDGSNRPYTMIGVREGHHDLSHHGRDANKMQKIKQINTFHTEQLAYMLAKLSSVQENGKSLLDQSMIVYGSGISDGDRHNHDDLPILLMGGGGGQIQGGRHIVYPKETPLMNLYMALFEKMGTPAKSFGDSTGTLKL